MPLSNSLLVKRLATRGMPGLTFMVPETSVAIPRAAIRTTTCMVVARMMTQFVSTTTFAVSDDSAKDGKPLMGTDWWYTVGRQATSKQPDSWMPEGK